MTLVVTHFMRRARGNVCSIEPIDDDVRPEHAPAIVRCTFGRAHFAARELFELPSEQEPWGLVVNEAMAAGLPVFVTDALAMPRT
jgi:hypothetical protein